MHVLVATSRSFLAVHHVTGESYVIEQNPRQSYHGIALSPQAVYVSARDRQPNEAEPSKEATGKILVYDYDLRLRATLLAPFPLRDLHQVGYYDGKLYAACSFDNMIAIYGGARWSKWYPFSENRDRDVNHFNSFLFNRGSVYLMAHNNSRGPSEVLKFDVASHRLTERFELGEQAHNLWLYRGKMYTCDSARGLIASQGRPCVTITHGFPRGIAVTNRGTIVGVSELAERKNREMTNGRLLVYASRWTQVRRITLEREGMVHDLRVPGVRDLCLPHGPRVELRVPQHLLRTRFRVDELKKSPLARIRAWWKKDEAAFGGAQPL